MTRASSLMRMTLDLLEQRGFTPTVVNGGKHLKVRWHDGNRRFTVTISRTPSDRNAASNARATLRRILRNRELGA